jgi:hypothetical protein
MSQISRLRSTEITDGNDIEAEYFNAEYDQLVAESNAQDLRITAIEDFEGDANTWTETQTFSAASDPIKTDSISERTAAAGVTIDSVLHKDGTIRVPGSAGFTPTTNGDFGYDSTSHTYDVYVNGAAKSVLHTGSSIDDLNDVTITSVTSGQVLKHNGTAWVNGAGATVTSVTSQVYVDGTPEVFAHGLGAVPDLIEVWLENVTGEYNWTTGNTCKPSSGSAHNSTAFMVYSDSTNVTVVVPSGGFAICNKTTGVGQFATAANWKLFVKVVKF